MLIFLIYFGLYFGEYSTDIAQIVFGYIKDQDEENDTNISWVRVIYPSFILVLRIIDIFLNLWYMLIFVIHFWSYHSEYRTDIAQIIFGYIKEQDEENDTKISWVRAI